MDREVHADCAALNCLPPHVEPTATGHIKEQIDMIDVLMKKGNAYRAADGSVYFKVSSFDDYGQLSRVKERELQTGSALSHKSQAVDADEKEDATDFALWKAHKADDGANAWDSPWGRGRPGWHIECSAMSKKHLGETIDLHTGGVDLLFPHHEKRDRPEPVLQRQALRPPLVSQRAFARGRQEDVQVARQPLHPSTTSRRRASPRWRCATPCSPLIHENSSTSHSIRCTPRKAPWRSFAKSPGSSWQKAPAQKLSLAPICILLRKVIGLSLVRHTMPCEMI